MCILLTFPCNSINLTPKLIQTCKNFKSYLSLFFKNNLHLIIGQSYDGYLKLLLFLARKGAQEMLMFFHSHAPSLSRALNLHLSGFDFLVEFKSSSSGLHVFFKQSSSSLQAQEMLMFFHSY